MPTPLPFTWQQANIAQNVLAAHAQQAQNQQAAFYQRQNQQAMAAFTGALRLATPALVAVAGVARSAGSQASFGARVGYGAVNYVAKNIGSATGSSFIERRLDWALFGIGTTGAGVLAQGLLRGAQTGQLSYDRHSGLQVGSAVTNSVTYGALGAVYKSLGVDIAGQGALMGAAERTATFTSEIARYGGKVTPEFRQWYFDLKAQEEARALEESKQVALYSATPEARGKVMNAPSSSPFTLDNGKFVEVLEKINATMEDIKSMFMWWFTGSD